jgi:hypothetical protein
MRNPVKYNGDGMDKNISWFRINHLLRSYTEKIKYDKLNHESDNLCLNAFPTDQILSSHGKRTQLIDQVVAEAIIHFTTCVWEKKEQESAGDILGALSGEHWRRKPYGTLIQDSRRR